MNTLRDMLQSQFLLPQMGSSTQRSPEFPLGQDAPPVGPIPRQAPNSAPVVPQRPEFDYDAAKRELLGDLKPTGWRKASRIAGVLGDALQAASGGRGSFAPFLADQNRFRQQTLKDLMEMRQGDYVRGDEAALKASAPFTAGGDRVQIDPMTGAVRMLYDAPEEFENYAETLGLVPGSDEYFAAVEDYVLRGHGPTAFDRSQEIDDYRTENDIRAENVRHGNRVGLRQTPTFRDVNGPPARRSGGSGTSGVVVVKTVAEAMALPSGTKFRTPDGRVKVRP